MPIYAYRCTACGHAQDVLQKMSDPLLTVCPACGAAAYTKQLTAAGFQLKGSGWYVTDFRGGNTAAGKPGAEGTESEGAAKPEAADKSAEGGAKADAKNDAKSDPKTEARPAKSGESPSAPATSPAVGPAPSAAPPTGA